MAITSACSRMAIAVMSVGRPPAVVSDSSVAVIVSNVLVVGGRGATQRKCLHDQRQPMRAWHLAAAVGAGGAVVAVKR